MFGFSCVLILQLVAMDVETRLLMVGDARCSSCQFSNVLFTLCYNLVILVLFSQMGPFFQGKMSTLLGTITYHPPPLFWGGHFGSRWWCSQTSRFRWDMSVDLPFVGSFLLEKSQGRCHADSLAIGLWPLGFGGWPWSPLVSWNIRKPLWNWWKDPSKHCDKLCDVWKYDRNMNN